MSALLQLPPPAADFVLESHQGRQVKLHAREDRLTLLVFIRGHWCPYCTRFLRKLQGNRERLRERGVGVLVVSPEPLATCAGLARQLGVDFEILSDTHGQAIDRFGVRVGRAGLRSVLSHPAEFLIDRSKRIRFRRIERGLRPLMTMHALITTIDAILQQDEQTEAALLQPADAGLCNCAG